MSHFCEFCQMVHSSMSCYHPAKQVNKVARDLVNKQIDDESLWHWARSDLEKALREALLEVHGVVEK